MQTFAIISNAVRDIFPADSLYVSLNSVPGSNYRSHVITAATPVLQVRNPRYEQDKHRQTFMTLHRCRGFYKLKARPSTSKEITICFIVVVRNRTHDGSKVGLSLALGSSIPRSPKSS